MQIAASYSFNGGLVSTTAQYPELLEEIKTAIGEVSLVERATDAHSDAAAPRRSRKRREPAAAFRAAFARRDGWSTVRVAYGSESLNDRAPGAHLRIGEPRELDFVKGRLGVGLQFRNCKGAVCGTCAKMTIFAELGYIDAGVEIVPVCRLVARAPRGIPYFEQFVWDLETRGVADIDIPVLILGVDA